MADVSLSTLRGEPRRKIVTLTASDSAVAIPSWAQGGKGIVYVTGCGGGGGGGINKTTANQRGDPGQSGATAVRHPILIPSGVSTLSAVIGAGGHGWTDTATKGATYGGDTTLTIGSVVLTLEGARVATYLGRAYMSASAGASSNSSYNQPHIFGFIDLSNKYIARGLQAPNSTLCLGNSGSKTADGGYSGGAYSLFGAGGASLGDAPSVNTPGGDATGYGAGGAGAYWVSGAAVSSGSGSPGLLILEFVEGF